MVNLDLKTRLKIREATREDVPVILSFIRDLAEFEKLSHEVVATEDKLEKTLFGTKSSTEVIIGELDGKPAAFALFFTSYSTFLAKPGIYLEDLFVRPEHRSLGIGRLMLLHLAALVRQRDYGRLEWSVLDWNEHAIRFYKTLGAVPMSDWTMFRLTGASLEKAAEAAQ